MNINDTVKTANELSTKGLDRISAFTELNIRAWEKLAGRQLDAYSQYMEHGLRLIKLATEAKGYNDFLKGQVEISKDVTESLMAETKINMKLVGEVREDYRAWYERSLADVTSDLRRAEAAA